MTTSGLKENLNFVVIATDLAVRTTKNASTNLPPRGRTQRYWRPGTRKMKQCVVSFESDESLSDLVVSRVALASIECLGGRTAAASSPPGRW